jgi:Flp pilus assembly protein TadG
MRRDESLIPTRTHSSETRRVHPRGVIEVALFVRIQVLPRRRARQRQASSRSGQSLVEFSLVLMPLFLILLGIIQFGFIFNTYITMTNAARDAGRLGTVYIYDRTLITKAANDYARNESIRAQVIASMNILGTTSPRFTTSSTWTQSGQTFTTGDLVITYEVPSGVIDSDPRIGERITVSATYHQDLVIPLVAALLPKDANGRMALSGVVTMVIN